MKMSVVRLAVISAAPVGFPPEDVITDAPLVELERLMLLMTRRRGREYKS